MKRHTLIIRRVGFLGLCIALAGFSLLAGLSFGAVKVPIPAIVDIFFGNENAEYHAIIWNVRFPRVIIGALTGMNLALSGALLQGVMKNPMADPHIIGVSSGAGLLGVLILIVFPAYVYLLMPVAFIGAMGAAVLVYGLAWNKGVSPLRIILSGVAVSALLNSGVTALYTLYSDRVSGAVSFMAGSLTAKSWQHVEMLWPYSIVGAVLALLSSKKMNVLSLGDDISRGLGLHTERFRFMMLALSSLLAASAVSTVGLLGFVGLIVPHAVRLIIGNDYRLLLPCSALLGAGVVGICDTLARVAFDPIELPVGIIMGFIGAPFFLYMLRKKKM